MSVSIKPLEDRIVIQQVEAETTTASGLVIPDTAKEKPQEGEVVAVGPGRIDDNGNRIPLDGGDLELDGGHRDSVGTDAAAEVDYSGEAGIPVPARVKGSDAKAGRLLETSAREQHVGGKWPELCLSARPKTDLIQHGCDEHGRVSGLAQCHDGSDNIGA